jgi:hydrocephalus-inducing protein
VCIYSHAYEHVNMHTLTCFLTFSMLQGGPEYEVKLEGEASSIQYKFDRTSIECGNILYDKFAMEDLTITNSGKVKLDFVVRTDAVARPSCVRGVPASGVLMPGEKTKISVHFLPGLPSFIKTQFSVEIAHFDPQVCHRVSL